MKQPKKFIVFANPHKDHAQDYRTTIIKWLEDLGCAVVDEEDSSADLAIILSGDGGVMSGLAKFSLSGIPTPGINAGNVGFLTSGEVKDWEGVLRRVIGGDYMLKNVLL